MAKNIEKAKNILFRVLIISVCCALPVIIDYAVPGTIKKKLGTSLYDFALSRLPGTSQHPELTVILLDDLRAGQAWNLTLQGELVRNLYYCGARTVAFADPLSRTPYDLKGDPQVLANATSSMKGALVLSGLFEIISDTGDNTKEKKQVFVGGRRESALRQKIWKLKDADEYGFPQAGRGNLPPTSITNNAMALGHVSYEESKDQVVRVVPAFITIENELMEFLPLAAVRVFYRVKLDSSRIDRDRGVIWPDAVTGSKGQKETISISLEGGKRFRVYSPGQWKKVFTCLDGEEVLSSGGNEADRKRLSGLISGKLCVVLFSGSRNSRSVNIPGQENVPRGVISVYMINELLYNRSPIMIPEGVESAAYLGASLLLVLLCLRRGAFGVFLMAMFFMVVYLSGAIMLMSRTGLIVDLSYPVIGWIPAGLGLCIWLAAFTRAEVAGEQHRVRISSALGSLQEEMDDLSTDLSRAKSIQTGILPELTNLPFPQHIRVATLYRPAGEIGGDFFDAAQVDSDRIEMVLADATGHGIAAAMVTTMIKAGMRLPRADCNDVKAIVEQLNQTLMDSLPTGNFVTLFYVNYCVVDRVITYVNGGHNPPALLVPADERPLEWVGSEGGAVLGVIEDAEYDPRQIQLYPGDRFLLCTDGIVEAHAPDGSQFGNERLMEFIDRYRAEDTQILIDRLEKEVQYFTHNAPLADDQTVLVLEVLQ